MISVWHQGVEVTIKSLSGFAGFVISENGGSVVLELIEILPFGLQ